MTTDQQILINWSVGLLPTIKKDGVMVVPDNTPLSSDEVEEALREIAEHDSYLCQTVSVPAEDGVRSILRCPSIGEEIQIERLPFADEDRGRTMPDGAVLYMNPEDADA